MRHSDDFPRFGPTWGELYGSLVLMGIAESAPQGSGAVEHRETDEVESRSDQCLNEQEITEDHRFTSDVSTSGNRQRAEAEAVLDLVGLPPLMEESSGNPEIMVGLLDGPVARNHPDLTSTVVAQQTASEQVGARQSARGHGTFVAGVLKARRASPAPAICPNCTMLLAPVCTESTSGAESASPPGTEPEDLAGAIAECVAAGATVLNISLGFHRLSSQGRRELEQVLNHAARREVLVIAAAGNQATLGGSAIVSHPAVIPVSACDARGRPLPQSNLGVSIGRRGFQAPGDDVVSLGVDARYARLGGTSVATPFVTGAVALLWSLFPAAPAGAIKAALNIDSTRKRTTVVPPLLDAGAASKRLHQERRTSLS